MNNILSELFDTKRIGSAPALALFLGSHNTAIVFQQLIFWHGKSDYKNNYFYNTYADIGIQLAMSSTQVKYQIKKLTELNYIHHQAGKKPNSENTTNWFRVNLPQFEFEFKNHLNVPEKSYPQLIAPVTLNFSGKDKIIGGVDKIIGGVDKIIYPLMNDLLMTIKEKKKEVFNSQEKIKKEKTPAQYLIESLTFDNDFKKALVKTKFNSQEGQKHFLNFIKFNENIHTKPKNKIEWLTYWGKWLANAFTPAKPNSKTYGLQTKTPLPFNSAAAVIDDNQAAIAVSTIKNNLDFINLKKMLRVSTLKTAY